MQVWLAYAFDRDPAPERARDGLARVENHYAAVSSHPLVRRGVAESAIGMVVWDAPGASCRWPAWAEDAESAVATAYVPVGWSTVIGNVAPADAPVALAKVLREDPSRALRLNPPFAVGLWNKRDRELFIANDAIGYARVYELRFVDGYVWSTQLGALSIFAGVEPATSRDGWSSYAAAGWFMDDNTPIENATILACGTAIRVSMSSAGVGEVSRSKSTALTDLTSPRSETVPVEAIVVALQNAARDGAALWDRAPIVDLSGGRDSRLVAAAAISAGVDPLLRTVGLYDGEIETATRLVAALNKRVRHEVVKPGDPSLKGSLAERALSVHATHDGTFAHPPLALPSGNSPPSIAHLRGVGGEIAHGHYYPRNRTQTARTFGMLAKHVRAVVTADRASTGRASRIAKRRINAVMTEGRASGITGLTLLDHFYLVERLRRWSAGSARPGMISPLITPAFVRASFDLTPSERSASQLHRTLIATLVPEWEDIPFYRPSIRERRTEMRRPMLWETADRGDFEEVLAAPRAWRDVFRETTLRRWWEDALAGRGTEGNEALFYRVAARHFFDEHLGRLRRAAVVRPRPVFQGLGARD